MLCVSQALNGGVLTLQYALHETDSLCQIPMPNSRPPAHLKGADSTKPEVQH
jgi:hypothetical protein